MKNKKFVFSLVFLAVLSACSKKNADEHLSAAEGFINEQQYSAAAIELRSAIKLSPEDAKLRVALAETMLKVGDSITAERELERAIQLGSSLSDIAVLLVKSYYLNNNFEKAANFELGETDVSQRDSLYIDSYKALALNNLTDNDAAIARFTILAKVEQQDVATFAQANLASAELNFNEALRLLDNITQQSYLFDEGTLLKAKLLATLERNDDAVLSFENYVKNVPTATFAKLLLAQTYVKIQNFTKADQQLDALLKLFPQQPYANHLKSIIQYEQGNFELAKQYSDSAVRFGMNLPESRIIGAMSAAKLNQYSQALVMLEPIASELPRFPAAQRLYALLKLNAGEDEQAVAILNALPEAEKDIALMAQTTMQLLRQGNRKSAESLLNNFQSNQTLDSAGLATLASIRLNIEGQRPSALQDLEKALSQDSAMDDARFRLITAYLEDGKYSEIERLTEEWLEQNSNTLAAYNLRAYAAYLQKDFTKAADYIEKSEVESPNNAFGGYLKALLLPENELENALNQLDKVIAEHPTYLPPLEYYYRLNRGKSGQVNAMQRVEKAFNANPDFYLLRLLMAQIYSDNQQFDKTLTILNAVNNANQNFSPMHYLMLIDAHNNLGQQTLALQTAEKWFRQDEQEPQAAFSYANSLFSNKEFSKSLDIINKLLSRYPENPTLQIAQVKLLAELKRYSQAIDVIYNMGDTLKDSADIQFMLGRLYQISKESSKALLAYQASYKAMPSALAAIHIVDNIAQKSPADAISFIDEHSQLHGSDKNLDTFKANLLINIDKKQAISLFAEIIKEQPSLVTLNNYAWLLIQDGQLTEAEEFVKQAIKIAPNHPDILDTYGLLLFNQKKYDGAITQFESSLAVRPDSVEVKLNYAEALIAANKSELAKTVLASVSDSGEHATRKIALTNMLR